MKETLTVSEVAKRLGVNPQTVRIGLQRGIWTFGYAVKNGTGNGWRYIIPSNKFNEFMGVKGYEENSIDSSSDGNVL